MSNENNKDHDHDKPVTIIVNGRPKEFAEKYISFEQVIILAFDKYEDNENIVYTVTYSRGEDGRQGTMVKGDKVKVKKDMIFNVTRTDKS